MQIERINCDNLDDYRNFTVNNTIDGDTVAFGAKMENFPCGAILAKRNLKLSSQWDIKIFFISKLFRNRGAGTLLLESLIAALKSKSCKVVRLNIVSSKESIEILQNFLSKNGFIEPEILTNVYKFNSEEILNGSNIVKSCLISKNPFENIKFLPFEETEKTLIDKVKTEENLMYPEGLSPFANEYNLEHVNSIFALENNEKIIAWISGLLAPGNMVLYRSFFVYPNYRSSALGLSLFNQAMKVQLTKLRDKEGICAVSVENPRVMRFISLYFKDSYKHKKYEFEMKFNLT